MPAGGLSVYANEIGCASKFGKKVSNRNGLGQAPSAISVEGVEGKGQSENEGHGSYPDVAWAKSPVAD